MGIRVGIYSTFADAFSRMDVVRHSEPYSEIIDMSKETIDKIDYIIALITEFAQCHQLSTQQAYLYLRDHKGLDFVEEFYDVEHTQSFENSVEDLTFYCQRMGGNLQ